MATTKRGSKLRRLMLVQCMLTAKRFSSDLKQCYERSKERQGSSKAIIATACSFIEITYHMLKHVWMLS